MTISAGSAGGLVCQGAAWLGPWGMRWLQFSGDSFFYHRKSVQECVMHMLYACSVHAAKTDHLLPSASTTVLLTP